MDVDRSAVVPGPMRASRSPDAVAPDGSEIRLLVGADQGASRASACEVTLGPGQVSRPVWHRQVEEIWYILAGQGQVWRCPPGQRADTVAPIAVGPGDALAIPTGWSFQFSADTASTFRFLCITSPPWPGPDEAQPAEAGGLGEATV